MNASTMSPVIERISNDVKNAAKLMSKQEARYLVDSYYAMQKDRIRQGNRSSQADNSGEPSLAIKWLADQSLLLEDRVGKMLDYYSAANRVGRWCRENKGIGPIIAAGLLAYIDITRAPTAGHIWSYAGINPDIQWADTEANKKRLKTFLDKGNKDELTNEEIFKVATDFNRNPNNLLEYFTDKETGDRLQPTLEDMAKYLARPPFNQNLKVLQWKIGESFVKIQNSKGNHYGLLVLQRKEYETNKNERGDYKELAARILSSKNWQKGTPTFRALNEGKLSTGHIHSRSKRWAVKIFLSHLHEVMYVDHFGTMPPKPFAIEHLGHAHYIPPFVDFRLVE